LEKKIFGGKGWKKNLEGGVEENEKGPKASPFSFA
jgi:hypothetical protein